MLDEMNKNKPLETHLDHSCSSAFEEHAPADEEETLKVAVNEDRAVWYLRIATALVLIGAALLVCLLVYLGAKNSETEDFEADFLDLSGQLIDSFHKSFDQGLGIYDDFTSEVTSFAIDSNATWPFVTVTDFERRAGRSARLARLLSILFIPIVSLEEKEEWEAYSVANKGWREEGIALQQGIPEDQVEVPPFPPFIYQNNATGGRVPAEGEGPFNVIWQTYPAIPFPFNNGDMHSHPTYAKPIDAVVLTKKTVFPPSFDFWGYASNDTRRILFNQYLDAYNLPFDYEDDPILPVVVPVFDRPEEESRQLKAVCISALYWRTYFIGLLPPDAKGVVVILENTCGQHLTYRISGSDAKFVGHGELFDTKYSHLEVTADFLEMGEPLPEDLQGAHCQYRLRVYPSEEFEDDRTTNMPAVYAGMLAAVFVFTSVVFLLYDYCVQKRQEKVMESAQRTATVVHSLFPKAVREQMYKDQENKKAATNDDWLNDSPVPGADDMPKKQEVNAHLYPETTICFSDIAGFTKWSSSRTPVQVFELLETIYGSFDKIARRRGVFKIETIGDCYVCATGIPEAQPDHAVIMAKFASDCLRSLQVMIHEDLVHRLGADCEELAMRFGFHSGPTTAGVLRGEKARFQIFGDTVNTAARMESNGVREKIQVSEASANLLKAAGKGHWVTPREDLVAAKGKGFMQTYWVTVKNTGFTASITSASVLGGNSSMEEGKNTDYTASVTSASVLGRHISMDEGKDTGTSASVLGRHISKDEGNFSTDDDGNVSV